MWGNYDNDNIVWGNSGSNTDNTSWGSSAGEDVPLFGDETVELQSVDLNLWEQHLEGTDPVAPEPPPATAPNVPPAVPPTVAGGL